jgi:hypothetical protein
MRRLTASLWLDGAGLLFLAIAAFVYAAPDRLRPPPQPGMADFGGAAMNLVLVAIIWFAGSLGALLLVSGPLLFMRLWYSWIGFFAMGALLWTQAADLFDGPVGRISGGLDVSHDQAFNAQCIGIASILMGFVFLIAQWLVRRDPTEKSERTL